MLPLSVAHPRGLTDKPLSMETGALRVGLLGMEFPVTALKADDSYQGTEELRPKFGLQLRHGW